MSGAKTVLRMTLAEGSALEIGQSVEISCPQWHLNWIGVVTAINNGETPTYFVENEKEPRDG